LRAGRITLATNQGGAFIARLNFSISRYAVPTEAKIGLFADDILGERRTSRDMPTHILHKLGCLACPLNLVELLHPKIKASGALEPIVFMLGEAPGEEEDKQGKQFVGDSGQLLREHIPKRWFPMIRWDNTLRCRPENNRNPDPVETECCRPLVAGDIEQTKPPVIFALGGYALAWLIGESGISNWRGRRLPVRVGEHSAWCYPFTHPAAVLRQRRDNETSEDEHFFRLDMERAFKEIEDLPPPIVHTQEQAQAGIETIVPGPGSAVRVCELLREAGQLDEAGVDFETSALRPYGNESAILSVAVSTPLRTFSFPFQHPACPWSADDLELIFLALVEFFKAPVTKLVHHLAFEQEWIAVTFGRELLRASPWKCSMAQAFVLDQRLGARTHGEDEDEAGLGCYGLGFLCLLHFGIDIKKFGGVDRTKIMSVPVPKLLVYNAVDARYHRLLFGAQAEVLSARGLEEVYLNHVRRIPTCVLTQVKGMPIDQEVAVALASEYTQRIASLEEKLEAVPEVAAFFRRTGKRFNWASNPDMAVMCRDVIGSKAGQQALGRYSVEESVLRRIKHRLPELVLELRQVSKNRSTYVFTADKAVMWPDGYLHPHFNTMRARTSRLTSSDPNGQNIPIRTEEGRKVRRQVAARFGCSLLSFDLGQIEARVWAMAARDAGYIKMLWEGFDIHGDWARRIALEYPQRIGGKRFLSDTDVMKDWRDVVKGAYVFAKFFGAGNQKCSDVLGVPLDILDRIEPDFWRQFPNVKTWQKTTQAFYRNHGYVEMLTGRQRCGPMKFAAVYNTPIQGTACEIVMDGMNRLSELDIPELQPLAQIHDDLLFEVPTGTVDECADVILREMLRPTFDFINVPLAVDMKIGSNWEDMQKVGTFRTDEFFKEFCYAG